jgi:hypothetical protein
VVWLSDSSQWTSHKGMQKVEEEFDVSYHDFVGVSTAVARNGSLPFADESGGGNNARCARPYRGAIHGADERLCDATATVVNP